METYHIFRDLAIIILAAKLFGMLARKLKAPQVVGMIFAGIVIGPSVFGIVNQSEYILQTAEIGVILLMFAAGLSTDLKELVRTGPAALLVACAGVFTPLVGGYILYSCVYGFSPLGSLDFYKAVFIGVIMTATSVSITVQSLMELGKLKTRVGTLILSAAIIDDVIGIIVMTFVIGMRSPSSDPVGVIWRTLLFFACCTAFGFIFYRLFKLLDMRYEHRRRIPIMGLALCFGFSYMAERYFGIADITGAYVAGIVLCNIHDSKYIAEKMDISSYMLFGPVFFASIGLKTSLSAIDGGLLLFAVLFVIVALITKIIGCGAVTKLFGYSGNDALKVGVGMMTRGEVALIVAQRGLSVDLLDPRYFTAVILLIVVSSLSTPIILKLLYRKDKA
ncbi:MAG: cation:proton antiporter [Oscillospiraceae bacterium]|nr:cation:proton antiporter [Oscillospiraceae bacterium]